MRRDEQRTPFNVGVWVVPMDGAAPEIADTFAALVLDLSPKGLSVIANCSISTSEVLICFSGKSEATFLRANILNCKDLGLGMASDRHGSHRNGRGRAVSSLERVERIGDFLTLPVPPFPMP